jgi:general secretion pathway protein E
MAETVTQRGHLQLIDVTGMPPERGMHELISAAIRLKASDLFLLTNEQHVAVQVRYLGIIEPLSIIDRDQGQRYLAHIRAEIGMDLSDHRRPSDGRWMYHVDDDQQIDLRISAVPTLYGEDMAIRLLVRDTSLLSIDKLGMTTPQIDAYRNMLDRSGGLIVLTGPTGAGKTVTMYAALTHLNNGTRKIHTIEGEPHPGTWPGGIAARRAAPVA